MSLPMPFSVIRHLLQIPLCLLIIAFIPGNLAKLAAFFAVWVITFGRISKPEAIFFAAVSVFFTVMNAASLKQGIFRFTDPDLLGMPVWELFMWGFYLLHTRRVLGGRPATGKRWPVWTLALLYAAAFATLKDGDTLLIVTALLLATGLALFHEREDLAYTGYLIVLGAAVEYVGVHTGQWSYPGNPPGGVPVWFITLWGGVGLFLRRLVGPIMARHAAPPAQTSESAANA